MSCIDFSVSQSSSDDLVLNFYLFSCCYHFLVSPSLPVFLYFLPPILPLHPFRFLSDSICPLRPCLLTGVLEPGSDSVFVLIYRKVIFGKQAKSLTFRSGVLKGDLVYSPRAASKILLRKESLTQEFVFGWYKSTCGVCE